MAPHDDHEWFSVEVGGDTYLFDLTFLSSSWTCIYGQGCVGIDAEPAPERNIGCCQHGAHLLDKADRKKTRKMAERLTDAQWQFKAVAEAKGGPVHRNDDGEWVTRTHEGACIFLNRPGFREGFADGAGCALHLMALENGERPIDTKPAVCWQLPLRLDWHTADSGHTTYILTEWRSRDWGSGGEDFHWWCTESHEAFLPGADPVWVTLRDEIVELVGQEPYELLVEHVTARQKAMRRDDSPDEGVQVTLLPHPAVRRPN